MLLQEKQMTAIYGIEMNFHGSQGGIFIMKKYSEMSKEELLTLKAELVKNTQISKRRVLHLICPVVNRQQIS